MPARCQSKKTAPAKAPHPARAPVAPTPPAFVPPRFTIPVITVPGAKDGEVIVRAGKPQPVAEEITTAQFAREVGLSRDYVARLCNMGIITARRKSPRGRSFYLIPRSQLELIKSKEALQ